MNGASSSSRLLCPRRLPPCTVSSALTWHERVDDDAVLRGDISRVARCTAITTGGDPSPSSLSSSSAKANEEEEADRLEALLPRTIKRSKPFKYAYEKEIVMYAYFKVRALSLSFSARLVRGGQLTVSLPSSPRAPFPDPLHRHAARSARTEQKLDYHSTECIYAPTAYRGYARALVKDLEAIRPSAIVDLVRLVLLSFCIVSRNQILNPRIGTTNTHPLPRRSTPAKPSPLRSPSRGGAPAASGTTRRSSLLPLPLPLRGRAASRRAAWGRCSRGGRRVGKRRRRCSVRRLVLPSPSLSSLSPLASRKRTGRHGC